MKISDCHMIFWVSAIMTLLCSESCEGLRRCPTVSWYWTQSQKRLPCSSLSYKVTRNSSLRNYIHQIIHIKMSFKCSIDFRHNSSLKENQQSFLRDIGSYILGFTFRAKLSNQRRPGWAYRDGTRSSAPKTPGNGDSRTCNDMHNIQINYSLVKTTGHPSASSFLQTVF